MMDGLGRPTGIARLDISPGATIPPDRQRTPTYSGDSRRDGANLTLEHWYARTREQVRSECHHPPKGEADARRKGTRADAPNEQTINQKQSYQGEQT